MFCGSLLGKGNVAMGIIRYNLAGIQLVSGEGALKCLSEELEKLSISKPLFVTDENLWEIGITRKAINQVEKTGISWAVYHGVQSDPLDSMVMEGLERYQENGCDGVVSIGGGSSMDTGKCISIMTVHRGKILDYARSTPGHLEFKGRGCPIISIPTTSGTGSEVSQYAVITNAETHRKTTVASPYILSNTALLDPELMVSMPAEVTAYTGMDALSHAIEAYTYKTAIEEGSIISDTLAIKAIELLGANILEAYHDGKNLEARKNMMWGALLAGVALNIGSGETHAIGSMLAKYYGVCHGISVGIPLPYCMEYNIPSCPQRFAEIAKALGVDTEKMAVCDAAQAGVEKVKKILSELHFPKMADYVHSMDEVRKISEECAGNSCCVSNGRMITREAVEEVFTLCLKA